MYGTSVHQRPLANEYVEMLECRDEKKKEDIITAVKKKKKKHYTTKESQRQITSARTLTLCGLRNRFFLSSINRANQQARYPWKSTSIKVGSTNNERCCSSSFVAAIINMYGSFPRKAYFYIRIFWYLIFPRLSSRRVLARARETRIARSHSAHKIFHDEISDDESLPAAVFRCYERARAVG